MTLQEAVDILRQHNAWRRDNGRCIDMVDPTDVGIAIDTVIDACESEWNLNVPAGD